MSILRTLKAVLWAFLGVRKRSSYEEDLSKLGPFHFIGVGLFAVAVIVGGLILLVNWVVKN